MVCQCPISGHPHFYTSAWSRMTQPLPACVNALTRAILISTGMNEIQENLTEGVNALTRAILISTLPLWSRLFKPLSGLVSARIFQNTLKNSPNRGQKWAEGKLYF